jgi:hypothetical protein
MFFYLGERYWFVFISRPDKLDKKLKRNNSFSYRIETSNDDYP